MAEYEDDFIRPGYDPEKPQPPIWTRSREPGDPCEFCGGTIALRIIDRPAAYHVCVQCQTCGAFPTVQIVAIQ